MEERWNIAAAGEGQVILLAGEPGIGKSRLSQQLLERLNGQSHFRLRYQCSPHHVNSAFYPIIRQLEHASGIDASDTLEQKLDKLETTLREGTEDISQSALLIAEMMSLPVERYPTRTLSPQRQKGLLFEELIDQVSGLSRIRPVMMLLEDVHWIDPTSLEAFTAIATRAEDMPVFLLITSRPEFKLPWTVGGHVSTLSLARLPKKQCIDLVYSATGNQNIAPSTVEQIIARTDGVPLFIEELARIVDDNETAMTQEIPSTLHALISSRLDQVSPIARSIAQLGSILGREFTFEIVDALSDFSQDEVDIAIHELTAIGLVTLRGSVRSGKIAFKHALIEDAAYTSQLISMRRAHHYRAATWYEGQSPPRLRAGPEVIAYHFIRAGEPKLALPHLFTAATTAFGSCAHYESISHLRSGPEILDKENDRTLEDHWRLLFLTSLGNAIMAQRGYADREAGEIFREALRICPKTGSAEVRFSILWNLWLYNQMSADLPEAKRMIEAMTPMVKSDSPDVQRLQLSHAGWTTAFSDGDLNAAKSHLAVGLSLYTADEHHSCTFVYGGHDPGVCAQCHCAFVQALTGNLDAGHRCGEMALTLAERLGHENSLTIAYAFGALGRYFVRDAKGAHALAQKGLILGEKYGPKHFEVLAKSVEAWAGEIVNEHSDAVDLLREGIDELKSLGAVMRTPFVALMLSEILSRRGLFDEALETIESALTIMKQYQANLLMAEALRLRGEVECCLGLDAGAETSFRTALDRARGQGARLLELRASVSRIRANLSVEPLNAHELLTPILDKMKVSIESVDVAEARALLAEHR